MVHRQDPRVPGDHRKSKQAHTHNSWKVTSHGKELPTPAQPKHSKTEPPPGKWEWTYEQCTVKDCKHWRKMNQFGREIESGEAS